MDPKIKEYYKGWPNKGRYVTKLNEIKNYLFQYFK